MSSYHDRYNYDPASDRQTLTGYVGLRNLGSTCYMNAILQQLFFTFPFRYLLLTSEMASEAHQDLQRIFTELLISRHKYCDTQQFCTHWKGMGGQPVNVREQQDVSEFLQALLEGLPAEMAGIFKGNSQYTVRGISEDYVSDSPEDFYAFQLEVDGFKNVEESFRRAIESEKLVGENQYSIDGRKIDAERYERIKYAPNVLVLQLKRFKYDIQTGRREKVTSHYEFPSTLDIAEFMMERDPDAVYDLRGIVLHSGTAQAGHYISLVLREEKWIEFNDMEVSEAPQDTFADKVYGRESTTTTTWSDTEYDNAPSAYLLFYVRRNAAVNDLSFTKEIAMDSRLNPAFVDETEQKNQKYFKLQALFDVSMCDWMRDVHDPEVLLKYFFNVFCHSALGTSQDVMKTTLENLLADHSEFMLRFCISNFDSISPIFLTCTNDEINRVFVDILTKILELGNPTEIFQLAAKIFDLLALAMLQPWRQTTKIGRVIAPVLSNDAVRQLAIDSGWVDRTLNFVASVYEVSRSNVIQQNLDLSPVFEIILSLLKQTSDPRFANLLKWASGITQSTAHSPAYLAVVGQLFQTKLIPIDQFINAMSAGKGDSVDALVAALRNCESLESVEAVMACMANRKISVENLACKLRTARRELSKILLTFPVQILFPMLTSDENPVRRNAYELLRNLFETVPDRPTVGSTFSDTDRANLNSCYQILLTHLEGLENFAAFVNAKGLMYPDVNAFKLVLVISFVRWAVMSLSILTEEMFSRIFNLYERFLRVAKHSVDFHVLKCASFLLRFPPHLILPKFREIFQTVMNENVPEFNLAIVFLKFKRVIQFLSLDDLHTII